MLYFSPCTGYIFTKNSQNYTEMCELYFCITDEVSEYFLRFLADFYNLEVGKVWRACCTPPELSPRQISMHWGGGDDENDYATTADDPPPR